MSGRDGWTERLLTWAVGDPEAAEGLLGDLEEEWVGSSRRPRGLRYRLVVVGLAARYLGSRLTGRTARRGSGDGLGRELGFALRSLLRTPGYSVVFAATLALGLGATLTVFTVLDSVVLRPLPYPEADRLVRVQSAVPGMGADTRWNLAKAQYLYLRDEVGGLERIGLYYLNVSTVGSEDRPSEQAERITTAAINPDVLPTLGLQPALGRAFTPEESLAPTTSVVILSHGYWTRAFGADPSALGRSVLVDGRPLEIVGIMPAGAALPEEAEVSSLTVDLWTPMYISPSEQPVNSHAYRSVGRLASGTDVAALNVELDRLSRTLPDVIPEAYSAQFMAEYGFYTVALPLHDDVVGSVAQTLWIVLGAVGVLLLVACFNTANLLLARTQRRSRELAIRTALGAGRGTLARQLLLESLVLALASGALALALAWGGAQVLVALAPEGLPRITSVGLSPTSVGLAVVASAALGVFFGLLPVLGSVDKVRVLGDTGRGMTASRSHHTARRLLVVAQLSASLVLLAGATLLFQSYRNLSRVESGVDAERVLTFRVVLPSENYPTHEDAARFYRQAITDLEAQPGVAVAGAVSALPLDGYDGCALSYPIDMPLADDDTPPCLPVFLTTPGYFAAMGIPVEGAAPTWDATEEPRVEAFVSRSTARRFWGEESALGRGISSFGASAVPIQGVVGDVRGAGLREPAWQAVYLSLVPDPEHRNWPVPRFLHVAVRTAGADPMAVLPGVRRTLAEVDPRVPMSDIRPMADVVAASTARDSFIAVLLGLASALSLMLSALGVYAVISYIVQGRRAEIGVRLALGAERGQVRSLVVGQSVRLAALGVVVGLALAIPLARVLRSFLFEMSPTDPVTLVAVSLALVGVAGVASFAPAVRATRVDPVEALRSE